MNRLLSYILITLSVALSGVAQVKLEKGRSLNLEVPEEWPSTDVIVAGKLRGDRHRSGMSAGRWGLAWEDVSGGRDSLILQWGNTDFGMDGDVRFLRVNDGVISQDFKAIHDGEEGVVIILKIDGGELFWSIGQDRVLGSGKRELSEAVNQGTIRIFSEGRDLDAEILKVACGQKENVKIQTPYTSEASFAVPADRASSPAGVWHYLDRDNDPAWSRPGGKYRLGIIEDNGDGEGRKWTVVYLDGAVTNSSKWKAGMEKGRLTESAFLRHYNLEWEDSMHERLGHEEECHATLSDDGMVLTLHFPLDKATIRLARPL